MKQRDKFEAWFAEYIGVPAKHLQESRYIDEDLDEGYDNLVRFGYTCEADNLASIAWLAWKECYEQNVQEDYYE